MNAYSSQALRSGSRVRAERASVSMPASVMTMNAYQFPQLANISQTGAKLTGSPLPARGSVALLRTGPLEILCRVVWSNEVSCGVRFEEPISPRVLIQIRAEEAAALEIRGTAVEAEPEPFDSINNY